MKSHILLTKKFVENDRSKIRDLPSANIRKWRNESLVHLNDDIIFGNIDLNKNYPIRRTHIEKIITTLTDVLNHYDTAYRAGRWAIEPREVNFHTQYVLDAIKR